MTAVCFFYCDLLLVQAKLIKAYIFWKKKKWFKLIYQSRLHVRWCLCRTKVLYVCNLFLFCVYIYIYIFIYRVSQEECARLWESVPYVKLYQYNPKHLCPKLNGYGDNGQRFLKLWQLLLTYWLPNTYCNWQEYVVSVMLIAVCNIEVTCEWHKAIKLNYKNTHTRVIVVLRLPSTLRSPHLICYLVTSELPCAVAHTPRSLHYHV